MAISGVTIGSGVGGAVAVVVPDVRTRSEADAKTAITAAGLRPVVRQIETSGTAGTVFNQDPAGGTVRNKNSTVSIFIIKTPTAPPVDIGQRLDEIKTAVGEANTGIGQTKTAVDGVGTAVGEVKTAVDQANNSVGQLKDAVGLVETDANAAQRQQEILDKLNEISERLPKYEPPKATGTTARQK
ncbi:PASTA domain-containing protein [Actinoplanes aureus]|uniref:PASTA domain-containing protein n=1 Tax=Actinoplanes aureus TaxID=2792083 RepID=A0A931C7I5_9ACTN|nr:PASTA domain-containing protein [Actinoplanes aureus]MBG0564860.1 PASTA domain-containing protein [Actinoplanes aureus]